MSEMVERVARMLEPELWGRIDLDLASRTPSTAAVNARAAELEKVKRAIASMREPTGAMLDAVQVPGIPGPRLHRHDNKSAYQAMIDAALEEK